jgi:hypothetical protein
MNVPEHTLQHHQHSAEEAFEDWLELSHITTLRRGVPPGGFLPAEYIVHAPTPVTIYSAAESDTSTIAVMVEKDMYGIVRAIKIQCACGCSATVALEYSEQAITPPNDSQSLIQI